ncbi:MAG: anthranilate synthase component 1 [Gammaproteobacteria bacterium]|nr:anthranilate synthase component 1 [Gammaproteobacteria bacterium]MDE2345776.1 anthranilate synthase component 1 [Gammaproteobacteria bacterium]
MSASCSVLVRRLEGAADPLRVYAAAAAAAGPSALFETADAGARESAQSLIFLDPWLSVIARDGEVTLTARRPDAEPLAAEISQSLGGEPLIRGNSRIYRYPPPSATSTEEAAVLAAPSVLEPLRAAILGLAGSEKAARIFGFGCFAYDLVGAFESLPAAASDPTRYPDFSFHLAGAVIAIDHRHASTTLAVLTLNADGIAARRRLGELTQLCQRAPAYTPGETPRVHAHASLSDAGYAELVARSLEHIAAGDVYQIVASRAWEAPCEDPLAAYLRLRSANPSPYMFYLAEDDTVLFGASPESALKVDAVSRRLEIRPIAGTRPRGFSDAGGIDAERDARLELELRLSEKEIAEHVMLVDLARNDVARVAVPGSRRVTELMQVERYSHVMHLVSRVVGELAPGLDALHAYRATLNMGTLTGAPKVRAAELLRRYEPERRGPYGGAVGYLTASGDLDTAIVIRSALVRDGRARVQAGAGVVADSEPRAEADETRRKAGAVLAALGAGMGDDHG